MSDKDFGEGNRSVRSIGIGHTVQGKRNFVEVAFGLDACLVDKVLIVRIVAYWMLIEARSCTQRAQIDIDDAIGLRQQARGFRWRLLAEVDGSSEQQQNDNDDRDCDPGAPVHFLEGQASPAHPSSHFRMKSGRTNR